MVSKTLSCSCSVSKTLSSSGKYNVAELTIDAEQLRAERGVAEAHVAALHADRNLNAWPLRASALAGEVCCTSALAGEMCCTSALAGEVRKALSSRHATRTHPGRWKSTGCHTAANVLDAAEVAAVAPLWHALGGGAVLGVGCTETWRGASRLCAAPAFRDAVLNFPRLTQHILRLVHVSTLKWSNQPAPTLKK